VWLLDFIEPDETMTGTGDSPDDATASKRAETLATIMASLRNIEAMLDRILARPEPPESGL
jgi:hypothetical protein